MMNRTPDERTTFMLKRLYSKFKVVLSFMASCVKRYCCILGAISRFTYSCMKGMAMFMLCGILAMAFIWGAANLSDNLPGPNVPNRQIEKNLSQLVPSIKHDYRRSVVRS